jgi:hypothetical protein
VCRAVHGVSSVASVDAHKQLNDVVSPGIGCFPPMVILQIGKIQPIALCNPQPARREYSDLRRGMVIATSLAGHRRTRLLGREETLVHGKP